MPSARLTQRRVDTLKPNKQAYDVRDPGLKDFGVRILPSGSKRYFLDGQTDGKRIWHTIDDAEAITLDDAGSPPRWSCSSSCGAPAGTRKAALRAPRPGANTGRPPDSAHPGGSRTRRVWRPRHRSSRRDRSPADRARSSCGPVTTRRPAR